MTKFAISNGMVLVLTEVPTLAASGETEDKWVFDPTSTEACAWLLEELAKEIERKAQLAPNSETRAAGDDYAEVVRNYLKVRQG
jgi:hypothetical protein